MCIRDRLYSNPKNHPSYIDGRSGIPYTFLFNKKLKEKIRKRDNYTCKDCSIPQKKYFRALDIHHCDFNKRNNKEDNLITLCLSCHMKRHINFKRSLSCVSAQSLVQDPNL